MIRLMRLEYLEDLESQTPRVLLTYGNDPRDAVVLRRSVDELAAGKTHKVRVDQLPGFQKVAGCSLVLSVGSLDSGVERFGGPDPAFRCELSPLTWKRVSGLLEPFERAKEPDGFQYLTETGSIEWIISRSRSW